MCVLTSPHEKDLYIRFLPQLIIKRGMKQATHTLCDNPSMSSQPISWNKLYASNASPENSSPKKALQKDRSIFNSTKIDPATGVTETGNRNRNIFKQHLFPNIPGTRFRNTKEKPIAGFRDQQGHLDSRNLTPVAGLNLLREKVSISQTQTQSSLISISVLLCSFMNPPLSVFSNRERKSPQRGRGRTLERMRHQCNTPQLSAMRCVAVN